MTSATNSLDTRLDALTTWLRSQLPHRDFTLAPASADASFRRYFRLAFDGGTLIAMDAPPALEDCRPFVRIAALLHDAGLHAPQIMGQDLDRGFLLLSDLGTKTYLQVMNAGNADFYQQNAISALLKWQLASRTQLLPPYDEALLTREVNLFPQWYVGRHRGTTLSPDFHNLWMQIISLLVANALNQPQVYVHRDYMPRNLMVSNPDPGVLDFQDAVYGPISYDVVSLFRDAFASWDEERVLDWTIRYWEQAKKVHLPVRADFAEFYREFEWMGLQRHLKVLGIFARIRYRDGKAGYLEDTPRFVQYARNVCERYGALSPLLKILDHLEDLRASAGLAY